MLLLAWHSHNNFIFENINRTVANPAFEKIVTSG
jgi:hypothetical protein